MMPPPMNEEHSANGPFADMDFTVPGVSIPQSDLRSSAHSEQPLLHYPAPAHSGYADDSAAPYHHITESSFQHSHVRSHFSGIGNAFSGSEYNDAFDDPMRHDFSAQMIDQNMLQHPTADLDFSDVVDSHNLAAALTNHGEFTTFPPCDDCTSETITSIPHHHHTSGRLPGASATLDGHFCCSWLVHNQPCFLCFSSAEALDNHIKNDHAGKDGTYRCLWQDCAKHDSLTNTSTAVNFGNKPKLMRHVHSHTGYKPFLCSFPGCDKGFVTKEQLRNHETTHTKSRKYKCGLCSKAFAVKSALTTHITAVHEAKKTHKCDLCGKAFADSSNLSKHKQTHLRNGGVTKRRGSKRDPSDGTSTRSSPSVPTPIATPATLAVQVATSQKLGPPLILPIPIAPTSAGDFSTVRTPFGSSRVSAPVDYGISTASSAPSPALDNFDPDCYCCDQECPPPKGPPTPCNGAEDCEREGFCDMTCCFSDDGCASAISSPQTTRSAQNEQFLSHQQVEALRQFQLPRRWDDFLTGGEVAAQEQQQQPLSHLELERQFTNMHGS